MNDFRFTRRWELILFRRALSTPLPRPDVERQGYFYEVRFERTKDLCHGHNENLQYH